MADGYTCKTCGSYCNGKDPHPGEVDEVCHTCALVAGSGWVW